MHFNDKYDSGRQAADQWAATMGRAQAATWQLGTSLDHQVVKSAELASTSPALGYFQAAEQLRADVGKVTESGQAALDAWRRGSR